MATPETTKECEIVADTLLERISSQKGKEKLDLSLCNMSRIPLHDIMENYGSPHYLDLSYNIIRYISPHFSIEFAKLTMLDLSRNELRKLPDNFGNLKQLVYLDIHRNKLETLPLSMAKLTRLQYLNVSDNPFRNPLKKLIDDAGSDISGTALAKLVVSVLQEMVKLQPKPTVSKRSVYFKADKGNSNYSELSEVKKRENVNNNVSKSVDEQKKDSIGSKISDVALKVGVVLVVFVTLIPLLVAYMSEPAYLENVKYTYPSFGKFWDNFYAPIHNVAVSIANYFPLPNCAWLLHGCETVEETGVFTRIGSWFGS